MAEGRVGDDRSDDAASAYRDRPDGLHEIARISHPSTTIGGMHSGHRIAITDAGVDPGRRFGHAGEKREGTSADFNAKHGDTIGNLESVLTHEIGHDVAARNSAAFEAFKKDRSYDRDALTADDLTKDEIELLDTKRKQGRIESNPGTQRRYSPQLGNEQYWGVDHTALPWRTDLALSSRAPGRVPRARWNRVRRSGI